MIGDEIKIEEVYIAGPTVQSTDHAAVIWTSWNHVIPADKT